MASSPPVARYGWIGIGNMGYGMAMNIATKMPSGSRLVICDINQEAVDKFKSDASSKGVSIASLPTPKEVAEQADIILTSLPAGPHVRKVFTNPATGILSAAVDKAKIFLETSTIDVQTSLEVLEAVSTNSSSYRFLDTPVSGGIPVAAAGKLSIMCGGKKELFDESKPVLDMFAVPENVFYCGEAGAGLATKQINNYIAYCSFIALCEGLNTGIRYGLDPVLLSNILNVSSGMSWNSVHMNPIKGVSPNSSANKDFKGGFSIDLARGVMDMAIGLGEHVGAKSVLAPVVKAVFDKAATHPKTKGQESRGMWKLFSENDGHDLD